MGFDLKAIQAQWDSPADDSTPSTGSGWDAPIGVPTNKSTLSGLSATDSSFTAPSNYFLDSKVSTSSDAHFDDAPSFQEDRPQVNRGHDNNSRSNSIHQRDARQNLRDDSRCREQFSGNGNNAPRREPHDFNHSSNSSDSGRYQKRFDNNTSQPRYGQGRGDCSTQYDFHQPDRWSNSGSASRNEYNQEPKPQQFQARGRDNSRSRASSSYQEASTVSESVEPRGRTRNAAPSTSSLETCLDWINYPKDLDIFYVMDIFSQVKGKRGILLKLKNEKLARLTFESVEFAQEAMSIFKRANQPGSIIPASDTEPPRTSANSQFASHHDSDHRSEIPAQSNRSSSRTSNQSAYYQRAKPSNGHQNSFSDNSSSRKPDTSQSNWAHSGSTNASDWNVPIESRQSSQVRNLEVSPKFTHSTQNTNTLATSRNLNVQNNATSEWDSPIDAKKSNASYEVNNSFGWEPQSGSKNSTCDTSTVDQSNNWDTPIQSKLTPEWEVPKPNFRQSPDEQEKSFPGFKTETDDFSKFEAPTKNNHSRGWDEPAQVNQISSWETPITNKKSSATRETSTTQDSRYTAFETPEPDFNQVTSKHQDLHLIPEPKAPTTALITDDQKAFSQVLSPEKEPAACLAIYNYPTFSPLDDLYSCFSQSVSESAFVTPTLLYLRFNSYSNALKACQDYKVSGRQGFARVANPPHYVNFISSEELSSNFSCSLSDIPPEDSNPHVLENNTIEKICPEKVVETTQPTNHLSRSTTSRQSQYPTPPPDTPVRPRVKPPTNTAPALRMIAHALGRRPPTNTRN